MFGTELVLVNIAEGAAYGAALLAGVGAGLFSSVAEAVECTVCVTDHTPPISENVRQYEALYSVYRSLYPALKSTFHILGSKS